MIKVPNPRAMNEDAPPRPLTDRDLHRWVSTMGFSRRGREVVVERPWTFASALTLSESHRFQLREDGGMLCLGTDALRVSTDGTIRVGGRLVHSSGAAFVTDATSVFDLNGGHALARRDDPGPAFPNAAALLVGQRRVMLAGEARLSDLVDARELLRAPRGELHVASIVCEALACTAASVGDSPVVTTATPLEQLAQGKGRSIMTADMPHPDFERPLTVAGVRVATVDDLSSAAFLTRHGTRPVTVTGSPWSFETEVLLSRIAAPSPRAPTVFTGALDLAGGELRWGRLALALRTGDAHSGSRLVLSSRSCGVIAEVGEDGAVDVTTPLRCAGRPVLVRGTAQLSDLADAGALLRNDGSPLDFSGTFLVRGEEVVTRAMFEALIEGGGRVATRRPWRFELPVHASEIATDGELRISRPPSSSCKDTLTLAIDPPEGGEARVAMGRECVIRSAGRTLTIGDAQGVAAAVVSLGSDGGRPSLSVPGGIRAGAALAPVMTEGVSASTCLSDSDMLLRTLDAQPRRIAAGAWTFEGTQEQPLTLASSADSRRLEFYASGIMRHTSGSSVAMAEGSVAIVGRDVTLDGGRVDVSGPAYFRSDVCTQGEVVASAFRLAQGGASLPTFGDNLFRFAGGEVVARLDAPRTAFSGDVSCPSLSVAGVDVGRDGIVAAASLSISSASTLTLTSPEAVAVALGGAEVATFSGSGIDLADGCTLTLGEGGMVLLPAAAHIARFTPDGAVDRFLSESQIRPETILRSSAADITLASTRWTLEGSSRLVATGSGGARILMNHAAEEEGDGLFFPDGGELSSTAEGVRILSDCCVDIQRNLLVTDSSVTIAADCSFAAEVAVHGCIRTSSSLAVGDAAFTYDRPSGALTVTAPSSSLPAALTLLLTQGEAVIPRALRGIGNPYVDSDSHGDIRGRKRFLSGTEVVGELSLSGSGMSSAGVSEAAVCFSAPDSFGTVISPSPDCRLVARMQVAGGEEAGGADGWTDPESVRSSLSAEIAGKDVLTVSDGGMCVRGSVEITGDIVMGPASRLRLADEEDGQVDFVTSSTLGTSFAGVIARLDRRNEFAHPCSFLDAVTVGTVRVDGASGVVHSQSALRIAAEGGVAVACGGGALEVDAAAITFADGRRVLTDRCRVQDLGNVPEPVSGYVLQGTALGHTAWVPFPDIRRIRGFPRPMPNAYLHCDPSGELEWRPLPAPPPSALPSPHPTRSVSLDAEGTWGMRLLSGSVMEMSIGAMPQDALRVCGASSDAPLLTLSNSAPAKVGSALEVAGGVHASSLCTRSWSFAEHAEGGGDGGPSSSALHLSSATATVLSVDPDRGMFVRRGGVTTAEDGRLLGEKRASGMFVRADGPWTASHPWTFAGRVVVCGTAPTLTLSPKDALPAPPGGTLAQVVAEACTARGERCVAGSLRWRQDGNASEDSVRSVFEVCAPGGGAVLSADGRGRVEVGELWASSQVRTRGTVACGDGFTSLHTADRGGGGDANVDAPRLVAELRSHLRLRNGVLGLDGMAAASTLEEAGCLAWKGRMQALPDGVRCIVSRPNPWTLAVALHTCDLAGGARDIVMEEAEGGGRMRFRVREVLREPLRCIVMADASSLPPSLPVSAWKVAGMTFGDEEVGVRMDSLVALLIAAVAQGR